MEENINLTAERSLEIITEQIKQSRKAVSQEVGQSLYISGLCIMGMAILITTCVLLTGNTLFYVLYGLIPVLVIGIDRYVKRDKPKAPVSLVGSQRLPLALLVRWWIRPGRRSASLPFPFVCLPSYSTF